MGIDLATWRPLFEFAMVLIVLGLAGCLNCRDRVAWWLSQGLIALGVMVGLAATGTLHERVDLFSLGMWLPLAVLLELIVCVKSFCVKSQRIVRDDSSQDRTGSRVLKGPSS
jgi:hypothetical protein